MNTPTTQRLDLQAAGTGAATQARILIVDDNAAKRLAMRAVLTQLGHPIVEADSGIAALRCVMADTFAVILLDVRMPDMDGFETAALIRQRKQAEMTPIIFITAYNSEELAQADRYVEGAVDFMFAPVAPAELRAKVSVFVNLFLRAESLAEQARQVQESANQLRMLTDAAPIGIFQTDRDNRYIYTNPRWAAITGVEAADAIGCDWHTIAGAEQQNILINSIAASDQEYSHRFELRWSATETRIVQVTSKPVPNEAGIITGWVGTLADVTAEAGAEDAMAAAWDKSLSNNRKQKSFAASASHELRTPTALILGFVEEILQNDDLSDEDRNFLEIVYRNAQRLNDLIDDLLIIGQTDIGEADMHLASTALIPLVERVLSNFTAAAYQAEITLTLDRESMSPWAMVDTTRLEQALTNLVSNAIKFTPTGGKICVRVRSVEDSVEIAVEDSGRGIDADDIDSIFERFFRTAPLGATAVKGSGLGLAIARGMIEAQHGQINVDSVVGAGSTFTITLPAGDSGILVAS